MAAEIREIAREYGPEAIERLVYWMRSGDATSSIAAAKMLIDRGYGKAVQPVAGAGGAPLVNINMNPGRPITDAGEAARIYAEILGRPEIDLSNITFASPAALPAPEAGGESES